MSDDQLVAAFEELTVEPRTFHHAEHVRLAFVYLRRHGLFETLVRYTNGLRRLVEHLGAPDKYNETVTCGLVVLIHERMAERSSADDWHAFAAANPDLLVWKGGAFFDYYDEDVLASDSARRMFVLPRRRVPHALGAASDAGVPA